MKINKNKNKVSKKSSNSISKDSKLFVFLNIPKVCCILVFNFLYSLYFLYFLYYPRFLIPDPFWQVISCTMVNWPLTCGCFLLNLACALKIGPYADSPKSFYTISPPPFWEEISSTKVNWPLACYISTELI